MREVNEGPDLELQIVVTGMHLSPEFGLTYRQIESDGFTINRKVECLLSSDSYSSISRCTGLAMIGFGDAYEQLDPDIVVVLGDRYEILAAASAALFARVPLAHLHGGEATEGAFDEAIRHSVTKMSHLHFTATEQYRNRVIQLGEQPERVFNVGALGIDNIKKLKLLSRDELERSKGIRFVEKNLLVTFHPATLDTQAAEVQFAQLLKALNERDEIKIIFTMPNADPDSRAIISMIDDYVAGHSTAQSFVSLGSLAYLSTLQYVDAVVGNSSSGLIEAPSFKIGTINIGDRQRGRIKADSVIDCDPDQESISKALVTLYSDEFNELVQTVRNPYGEGGAAEKISMVLGKHDLSGILKKEFHNLEIVA